MIIIHKPTGSLMNEVEFRDFVGAVDSPYRHILFDISHEGFDGSDFAIVDMPTQPIFDGRYQTAAPVNVAEVDGSYSGEWGLSVIDFGDDRQKRKDLIAEKRWEEETSHIEYGAYLLHADRDSRLTLLSMFMDAKLDPDYNEPEFKSVHGFVSLSNADILAIGVIVKAQVRAAYARESQLLDMIDAGDPITPLDW